MPPTRRRRWRRSARLAAAILLAVVAGLLVRGDSWRTAPPPVPKPTVSVRPAPIRVDWPTPAEVAVLLNTTPKAIAPVDAVAINAARPLDRTRVTAAVAFGLPIAPAFATGNAAALDCLTKAVYYEAASESDRGERAVAQVVLNRMRSPIFPHTVCGVVFQGSELPTGCQFSFTCDGSLRRVPSAAGWARARRIAAAALSGWVERSVGLSTHYHANYVVPYWADSLDKAATIGAHIFYVMRGGLGRSAGFRETYAALAEAGSEPLPPTDPLTETGAEGTATTAPVVPPKDRTQVAEDVLGTPTARPQALPDAPGVRLNADEAAGKLVVDDNKAVLRR